MTDKQPEALRLAELLESIGDLEAADELRRLHQVDVAHGWWLDKTEWVQESSEGDDLGRHRADVMKQRIDRLRYENEALRAALEQPQGEQEPVAEIQVKNGHWIDTPAARTAHLVDGVYKLYTRPQPKRELMDNEARRIYNEATYHASIAVFMTRMDSEQPDADEKGVSGWLQEAEDRVKHRIIEAAHNK